MRFFFPSLSSTGSAFGLGFGEHSQLNNELIRGRAVRFLGILGLVFTCVLAHIGNVSAKGFYQDWEELKILRHIHVIMHDQVTGGCLPQPNVLKVEAELILRQSNISVLEEYDFSNPFLDISSLGYSINQDIDCAVYFNFTLKKWNTTINESSVMSIVYTTGILISGPKSTIQKRLRDIVSEYTTDLANEILKARGQ